MAEETLDNGQLRAVIDPDNGMALMALDLGLRGKWVPLTPDAREEANDLDAASFLMVPYSNRIADGTFTFNGQSHELMDKANHAIHGDVRHRPWVPVGREANFIKGAFLSERHEEVNWPWPFEVRCLYQLNGPALVSELTLINRGETPMPAGFGWHPYYNRKLTAENEPVELKLNCTAVYPDANDNRIPSGPAEAPGPDRDFSAGRALPPEQFLDICCCGYDGNGTIRWPDSGVTLRYACSEACSHLVLYNPTDQPYFAVEPVTNANNGVNLLAGGDETSGVAVLAPGEQLTASFEMRVELD